MNCDPGSLFWVTHRGVRRRITYQNLLSRVLQLWKVITLVIILSSISTSMRWTTLFLSVWFDDDVWLDSSYLPYVLINIVIIIFIVFHPRLNKSSVSEFLSEWGTFSSLGSKLVSHVKSIHTYQIIYYQIIYCTYFSVPVDFFFKHL